MAIGTDYNVKQDLIAAVVAKVFKNDNFGITGEGLQKALCDMIESLWGDQVGSGTGAPNYVERTHAHGRGRRAVIVVAVGWLETCAHDAR